MLHNHITR